MNNMFAEVVYIVMTVIKYTGIRYIQRIILLEEFFCMISISLYLWNYAKFCGHLTVISSQCVLFRHSFYIKPSFSLSKCFRKIF